MPQDAPSATLERAVSLLSAEPIFVLTGAGMSTDSGIPDYRGPDSVPRTPITYSTFLRDESARAHYWARSYVGWASFGTAAPNDGHLALAELQERQQLTGVVTQNVDGLHQRAGTKDVIDLHGRLDRVRCLNCENYFDRHEVSRWLGQANPSFAARLPELQRDAQSAPDGDAEVDKTDEFVVVACPICGGILKPDVVFFGEQVPRERVDACYRQVEAAAAVLVLGSSLTVMSGLRFVRHAARRQLPIVIVNRGKTRADDIAMAQPAMRLHLDSGVSEFLRDYLKLLVTSRS
ncbi:NAD-dependent protein deacetylase [Saxibacter everestensis]|uniref:NAD-dependent protein deacetylase n=1 Tax=Saxibacter everestensis TaxID=2909229 RepID=A0ABY8QXV1_9MICO|nr:NAD-dependent protein deacetylase [Brevibacteriaceae bacterium ZFBP1038]